MSAVTKAIETAYNGYRFRSRLEARWAVFFNALGIKYEYEKEGYDLDGIWYLPDFWLPDQDCWIEIKGQEPTEEENNKAEKLAKASGKNVYIFLQIPEGIDCIPPFSGEDGGYVFFGDEGWDLGQMWCECPKCHKLGIEFEGRADRLCNCFPDSDKGYNFDSEQIKSAYTKARQARFEHGETPTIKTIKNTKSQNTSSLTRSKPILTIERVKKRWECIERRIKSKNDGNEIEEYFPNLNPIGVGGTKELPIIIIQTSTDLSYDTLQQDSYHRLIEWASKIELLQDLRLQLLPPVKTTSE